MDLEKIQKCFYFKINIDIRISESDSWSFNFAHFFIFIFIINEFIFKLEINKMLSLSCLNHL